MSTISNLEATSDSTAAVDGWDASHIAPTSPQPDAPSTDESKSLMFNNYTKDEVAGLHDQDPRSESNAATANKTLNKKSKRSKTTDLKKPKRKRKRARGNGTKGNRKNKNVQSQPNLMSVDDMFKLGFGKAPQGHMGAHRGHTPKDSHSQSLNGPAGRLFQLTGRAPNNQTLVDTLLDFPIPDIRSRPKTVSPRTRRAREDQWKKMVDEREAVQRAASRGGSAMSGSRRGSTRGSTGGENATTIQTEDPAMVVLREKQEAEKREEQEMLAQTMGLSVEEMVALDQAANEGTEDAIAEYMEAFHRIDVDGSGSLSPDELRDVMHELGEDMNETELEAMISEADHDGDGEIDYDEFTSMMRARKRRELLARNMTKAQGKYKKATQLSKCSCNYC